MDKLLLFPGKTDKGIFTYVVDSERNYLEKTAAEYHPTIAAYINNAKPIPGRTQILLTALGAYEWWGDNVNSDAFQEHYLAHDGDDYGYKTFEKYAKVYRHHVNKDPKNNYGDVLLSVYNPTFHRVELIVGIRHDNGMDIVRRIETGDYPDWSMGVKVKFDSCSICGNRAPTRKQYCDHARYMLGKIDPASGRKVFVFNHYPKFFDISQVLIGADRIAKTLQKVASPYYGNLPVISSAYLAEKMAEKKQAEMEKEIPPAQPPASTGAVDKARMLAKAITEVKAMEPPFPRELLDDMARSPLPRILSTMTMMGIVPKPQEFQRIFLIRSGQRQLADSLDRRGLCFDPMSAEEPTDSHLKDIDVGPHNFDEMLMQKLSPFMADRSYAAPHLGNRLIIMIKQGTEYPLPSFIKVSEEDVKKERNPVGPMAMLLAAAGAYVALTHIAPKEAVKSIDKLLSTKVGLGIAATLGLGLLRTFNTVAGPKNAGQAVLMNNSNPDTSDVYSRIEALKQKPFSKVGAAMPFSMKPAAKRLFLGVPLAYMASGVLQKHKELSPYQEEGRIKSFIRRNPDVISAALIADAMLSVKGHPISSRNVLTHASELGKGLSHTVKTKWQDMNKAFGYAKKASVTDDGDFLKMADDQEIFQNSLIWPLAMGARNLPGRVAGSLFDQAVLRAGSKILSKKNKDQS